LDTDGGFLDLVQVRHEHLSHFDEVFTEAFREAAEMLPVYLAADIAESESEQAELEEVFRARVAETWPSVIDPMTETDYTQEEWKDEAEPFYAALNMDTRRIVLNYGELLWQTNGSHAGLPTDDEIRTFARHEALHAFLAIWYDTSQSMPVQSNGIDLRGEDIYHGEWINEGIIEEYRSRLDQNTFTHIPNVLLLKTADALDPGFRVARLRAALLNEKRGQMIGRLELLFGPGAPETVRDLILEVEQTAKQANDEFELALAQGQEPDPTSLHEKNNVALGVFKEKVIGLLRPDQQEAGAAALEAAIGWYNDHISEPASEEDQDYYQEAA
jgi:hypothetical protein